MPFQPGESGNPAGRPRGSFGGRTLALRALDELLAEEPTIEILKRALAAHLRENPIRFFKEIVLPLLPRQAVLDLHPDEPVRWVGLLDTCGRTRDQVSSQDASARR